MSLKVYILEIILKLVVYLPLFIQVFQISSNLTFLCLSVVDLASKETYKGVSDFEVP